MMTNILWVPELSMTFNISDAQSALTAEEILKADFSVVVRRAEMPTATKINRFRSGQGAVKFVRKSVVAVSGAKFSVGVTPMDAGERMRNAHNTIFVRWTGGPSFDEVRAYLQGLNVLMPGDSPVRWEITRKA
jgi:hypothetical protein